MNQGGQAIFRSLTSDLDDLTVTVGGGVKLKLVFGDITNETTDAVVNATNTNFQNGVCRNILSAAGPEVEAELKTGTVSSGNVLVSGPGWFPTSAIFHVCGEKDARVIQKLVLRIVENCEAFWFKSVAIPAICAGAGGLDPRLVAGAILRGVRQATSSPIVCLTDIRIALNKIKVFLAFKEEAMQVFSSALIDRGDSQTVPAPPPPRARPGQLASPPGSADLSSLRTSSAGQQSVFLFLGLSRVDVDDATAKLKGLYHAQCSTKTFREEELAGLTQDDVEELNQLVELEGLYVQRDQPGTWAVSGLKDGVHAAVQMINASLQGSLRREVRLREEEDLFNRVAWCIQRHGGNWVRLPKTANHNLENDRVAGGITDAQNTRWSVEPRRTEATDRTTGQTAKLKRLEHLSDFTFPLYWDNMAAGEAFKKVTLQPSSAEHRAVKEGFKQTVQKTVMKIERLQNVHLRRAYEAQKKHICDKNQQRVEAGEKLLYHGTTHVNCDSIGKTGFNRSFSGQNGTSYGKGTYFAVDASYSAHPTYSAPAPDGSQLMFVVRVATGIYAAGQSHMRTPPTRGGQRPDERYDSVVDDVGRPSMYVVFHDDQAYPDYLITFK
ncbi:protein mono-ADP-ribosyltransferase PARP15 [Pungitius pungitius]|uniref:protein mono-ADP-ribosyltransferase PARP15 n=1 Tax=Pungitius pungitius TaxID=134920 RepID=UPI002E0EDE17